MTMKTPMLLMLLAVVCATYTCTEARSLKKRSVKSNKKLTDYDIAHEIHFLQNTVKKSLHDDLVLTHKIDDLKAELAKRKAGGKKSGPKPSSQDHFDWMDGEAAAGGSPPFNEAGEYEKPLSLDEDSDLDGSLFDSSDFDGKPVPIDDDFAGSSPASQEGSDLGDSSKPSQGGSDLGGSPKPSQGGSDFGVSPKPGKGNFTGSSKPPVHEGEDFDGSAHPDQEEDKYIVKLNEILATLQFMTEEPFYAMLKSTFGNLDNICGHVIEWIEKNLADHFADNYGEYDSMEGGPAAGDGGHGAGEGGHGAGEGGPAAGDGGHGAGEGGPAAGNGGHGAGEGGPAAGEGGPGAGKGGPGAGEGGAGAGEGGPSAAEGGAGAGEGGPGAGEGGPGAAEGGPEDLPAGDEDFLTDDMAPDASEGFSNTELNGPKIKRLLKALSRVRRQAGRPNDQKWAVVAGVCFAYEHLKYAVPIPHDTLVEFENP